MSYLTSRTVPRAARFLVAAFLGCGAMVVSAAPVEATPLLLASAWRSPDEAPLTATGNGEGIAVTNPCANTVYVECTAMARATYGRVGAQASGSVVTNGGAGSRFAQASAFWSDDLTIVSDSLAPGTLVQFRATVLLFGSIDIEGFQAFPNNLGSVSGSATTDFSGFGQAARLQTDATRYVSPDGTHHTVATNPGLPLERVLTVSAAVGSRYTVSQSMTAWVNLHAVSAGGVHSSFFNSAHFHLEPVGNGFAYTSASGFRYHRGDSPTPVPEPATVLLVGPGLAAAILKLRRRHRARAA
jgi:hypothetical protein